MAWTGQCPDCREWNTLVEQAAPHEVRCKHDMSTGDPGGFYAALGYAPTGQHNSKGNIELLRRAQPTTKET